MWTIWNNPVANMHGPTFLVFYALLIVTTWLIVWLMLRKSDDTLLLPRLQVPLSPNVYEIAYLRGGVNEVIRVALYKLLKQKYLIVQAPLGRNIALSAQTITINPERPPRETLSPIEDALLSSIELRTNNPRQNSGMTVSQIFASSIPDTMKWACRPIDERMVANQLLFSAAVNTELSQTYIPFSAENIDSTKRLFAALTIAGIGGYKLTAALIHGHTNVWFLVCFALVGVLVCYGIKGKGRLTNRGREYLKSMQRGYSQLCTNKPIERNNIPDAALIAVAAFGLGVLASTPDAAYGHMFKRSSVHSFGGSSAIGGCNAAGGSSSCGSGGIGSYTSSGTGSCGSGGSSGGCGSGGGGGCGGCGGGG